jgi:acyl carrier protein
MEELKQELKRQIVEHLNLKDVRPEDIEDDAPLFKEGLGLDSIDALELIVMLQKHYGLKLSNSEEGPVVFRSISSMAQYIEKHR